MFELLALFLLAQIGMSTSDPITPPHANQSPTSSPPANSVPVTPPHIGSSTRSITIAAGRALAQNNCQTCHAIDRTGRSPNSSAPPFRTLAQKYPIDSLSETFAEGVLIGHSAMPEFQFEPDQVENLLTYIKSVQVSARVTKPKSAAKKLKRRTRQ
jgi:cytochrome c